ncbi:MAG: hypothetical protein AAB290_06945, partial [Candidatus Eisenbacteria bacterium]
PGDLIVGNGTPGVAQNGEDGYIEGTFEVDGAAQFDGAVTATSTLATTGIYTPTGGVAAARRRRRRCETQVWRLC